MNQNIAGVADQVGSLDTLRLDLAHPDEQLTLVPAGLTERGRIVYRIHKASSCRQITEIVNDHGFTEQFPDIRVIGLPNPGERYRCYLMHGNTFTPRYHVYHLNIKVVKHQSIPIPKPVGQP